MIEMKKKFNRVALWRFNLTEETVNLNIGPLRLSNLKQ